jgi:ABC-type Fe3+-hydroxamate transport system substrate-binding protein
MKTRNILISFVLLIAGSFSTEFFAQDNIKALTPQIEKMDDKEILEADIVRKNNPTLRTKSFTMLAKLKYSPELEKKLIDTFQKDSEKATQVVEQKKDGKVSHFLYRFDTSMYSFTINNDTISVQARESIPLIRKR